MSDNPKYVYIVFATIGGKSHNRAYVVGSQKQAMEEFFSEYTLVNGDSYQVFVVKSMNEQIDDSSPTIRTTFLPSDIGREFLTIHGERWEIVSIKPNGNNDWAICYDKEADFVDTHCMRDIRCFLAKT